MDYEYFEIVERVEIRNVTFLPGRIIYPGDFPPAELLPWVKTGKVKHHNAPAPAPTPSPVVVDEDE